jgi:RNA polymerase sigma factor (sigma-70 family)
LSDHTWLAAEFDEHRSRLRAVALRVLGSRAEAEDAVQEAWFRLNRSNADRIENIAAWLTTVVARVSLDMLRSRTSRREQLTAHVGETGRPMLPDPAAEAELADSVGLAVMVLLERLAPAERLAFVLHDIFAIPFDEVGVILERSPTAAKQLAYRARSKVRGANPPEHVDAARQRQLVALLHPDIVLEADTTAVRMGAPALTRGSSAVASVFSGRALTAQAVTIDGSIGIAWIVAGRPTVLWNIIFAEENASVIHIDLQADPARIASLEVIPLPTS